MSSSKIKYIITFLIMLLAVACETDVDLVNAPVFKQRLVVTSFISPTDTVSYFRVTSNIKIYGELHTEEPLGLLSGSISDGLNEVELDTCKTGLKLNHEKMQIQYGKTYKLKVSSDNGLKAEAECTVPFSKTIAIEADTFSVLKKYPDYYTPYPGVYFYRAMYFRVTFSDLRGEENYYRIFGKFIGYYKNLNPERNFTITDYLTFNEEFISDKGRDGNSILLITENNHSNLFPPTLDSMFLKIYLYNTEKSYYQFHKSLRDYNDGENPFSEASPVFSNISGGFGIFTSYTIDSLVVRLK